MKRLIFHNLIEWMHSDIRKPLLIRGARQVGKTHLVRQLGKKFKSYLEVNFERRKELFSLFEENLDPKQICEKLELIFDQKIIPQETLLFFDEIQVCPRAILALRYFYEEMPELHVIAAGSLLEFAIEQVGVPVGRISFCYVFPMSFIEFLLAIDHELLSKKILSHSAEEEFSEVIHHKTLKLLGEYMLIGGMPEAVAKWIELRDIQICQEVHNSILNTYRQDFEKYAKKTQLKYLELLFDRIPQMICETFKFSQVTQDYQKRELAPCLDLLVKAGIVQKIFYSASNGIPLGAEMNPEKFKVIFLDVALTQTMLGLDIKDWILQPEQALDQINKGKIAEALIGQELLAYSSFSSKPNLFYWQRNEPGSTAEVDYVTSIKRQVIPIEVKGGKGSTLRSLHAFLSLKKLNQGWRFSTQNYHIYEKIYSYPLYSVAGAINATAEDTINF